MKKLGLSIFSGLLFAFSWPSIGLPILLFFAFIPLLYLEEIIVSDSTKKKNLQVFSLSFLAFLLFNIFTIRWLYELQNPDGSKSFFGFLFPWFANAFLMAIAFQTYHFIRTKIGRHFAYFYFPWAWMVFEKLHTDWDCQWPWLTLGNAFGHFPTWVQWYEFTGVFGGSFWVLLGNIFLFYFLIESIIQKKQNILYKGIAGLMIWIALPIFVSLIIFNQYEEKGKKIHTTILQPNIDPYTEKYTLGSKESVDKLLRLSIHTKPMDTALIVAPETAIPGGGYLSLNDLDSINYQIKPIQEFLLNHQNVSFLTGASTIEYFKQKPKEEPNIQINENQWVKTYNSALLFKHKTKTQVYHKSKLVVGVEHFPFRKILMPIMIKMLNLGGEISSLSTQKKRKNFNCINTKIAPIICYESIFGEFVNDYVKNGAQVLAIITNDGWWGNSDGHKQHLAFASLRAIETRKSVIRSADTGISAIINPRGEIIKKLNYGKEGILQADVYANSIQTYYIKNGDYLPRLGILFVAIFMAYAISLIILSKIKKK